MFGLINSTSFRRFSTHMYSDMYITHIHKINAIKKPLNDVQPGMQLRGRVLSQNPCSHPQHPKKNIDTQDLGRHQ